MCFISDTLPHSSHIQWFRLPENEGEYVKQWRHGAMVGWRKWMIELYCYLQKLFVCVTAHHPLMMACIYCTPTHKHAQVYLYTYCTHAHICMCLENIWVRRHHCDQPVSIGWPKNSMIHHQRGTLRTLVRLWKRSALFLSFLLAGFFLFYFFCRCSKKPLYGIRRFAVWQTFALYISLLSRASHYSSKQLVFYIVFPLFCEVMPFYQSNRLAAVFEWPGPHTHTSQTVQTQNKCTDNQRERNGWGKRRHPGSDGPGWHVGPGRAVLSQSHLEK